MCEDKTSEDKKLQSDDLENKEILEENMEGGEEQTDDKQQEDKQQDDLVFSEESEAAPEVTKVSASSSDLVVVSEQLPPRLLLIPLRDRPVFPGLSVPLVLHGEEYVKAIRKTKDDFSSYLGVVLSKQQKSKDLFNEPLHKIGVLVRVFKVEIIDEDVIQVFVQSMHRFEILKCKKEDNFLLARVKYHQNSSEKPNEETRAYAMAIMSSARELLKLNPIFQEQLKMLLAHLTIDRPGLLMDVISSMLMLESGRLQELLEALDLHERGKKLLLALKDEIEVTKIQDSIHKQIDEKVNHQQKEFFLKEQLKLIKQELGIEKDDKSAELEKIEKRLRKRKLSKEAEKVVADEMKKIRMLDPASPEYGVSRNYLDIMTELPWGIRTQDTKDIGKARKILDKDHYGLKDVKTTILAFISIIIKKGSFSGNNILLLGPPGVGKTSVGRSIATALGRKFFRFSVGGMRDEAEIKGHRRTYIGAMPGKLIEGVRRSKSENPVILIDELDKIGQSYQGDPASALLEVLDPEQNNAFLDHYLDVPFDLSHVLFIATANQTDSIPGALLDRMEIIRLPGYIAEEKMQIAKKYLLPKQRKMHGLSAKEIKFSEPGLRQIIEGYAREAGVRNLNNQIKKIMRQVTLAQAEGKQQYFKITLKNLEKYLGKAVFSPEELYTEDQAGVALGLAYTAMGGATLYVEASSIRTPKASFKITGQMGDVMKESSHIAYSHVRALCAQENAHNAAEAEKTALKNQTGRDETSADFFENRAIHLHIPEGATPKDGPSAGITMALALYSLATQKPIRRNVAMTGELTLTGKVLPIGGVREKTIAARRVGIREIILPKANQKDFEALPKHVKDGIKIHYVRYFREIPHLMLNTY